MLGEELEQRAVADPGERAAGQGRDHLVVRTELGGVGLEPVRAQHDATPGSRAGAHLDDQVLHVGSDGEGEVRRQRPRRRRPRPELRAVGTLQRVGQLGRLRSGGLDAERHRECGVLAGPGRVVEADLEVRQRRLRSPRVRHDPVRLVDQASFPQLAERPDHRLHVVEIHRLVVVVEVDPAGLAGDVALPLAGVAQHRRAARVVERCDAEVGDADSSRDAELLLGGHLGGQTVAVPAEPAIDAVAAHGLVAGHDVLDVAGQQVAVVRQAVRERGAVVEDELVVRRPLLDGALEGALGLPAIQDPPLDRREVGTRRDLGVGAVRCVR